MRDEEKQIALKRMIKGGVHIIKNLQEIEKLSKNAEVYSPKINVEKITFVNLGSNDFVHNQKRIEKFQEVIGKFKIVNSIEDVDTEQVLVFCNPNDQAPEIDGKDVFYPVDCNTPLKDSGNLHLTTFESFIFECLKTFKDPEFKQVLALAKDRPS